MKTTKLHLAHQIALAVGLVQAGDESLQAEGLKFMKAKVTSAVQSQHLKSDFLFTKTQQQQHLTSDPADPIQVSDFCQSQQRSLHENTLHSVWFLMRKHEGFAKQLQVPPEPYLSLPSWSFTLLDLILFTGFHQISETVLPRALRLPYRSAIQRGCSANGKQA